MTKGQPPAIEVSPQANRRAAPGSWVARAALDTAGQWGARLGLAWVVTMIVLAVFAPFIANSHPYMWKLDGQRSFPLFQNLSAADLTLLVMFFAGAVLLFIKRIAFGAKVQVWAWLIAAAALAQAVLPTVELIKVLGDPDQPVQQTNLEILGSLLAPAAAVIVLAFILVQLIRKTAFARLGVLLAMAAAIGVPLFLRDAPPSPDTVIYSQYREALTAQAGTGAIFAPIAYSPSDFQRDDIAYAMLQPPTWNHPMGTSDKGADVASRMIYATRVALIIGFIATGLSLVIGIVVGGLMGYFSGIVDLIGMRFVEIFSAIPVIFLLILICAVYDRNIYLMMTVIGLTGWVGYAIFIRAEFLKLRSMDYVMAARAAGTPLTGILFRHLLPNGIAPVLVLASFGFASAILFESSLSFLGLGLPPQDPSWGQLLQEARANGGGQWWLVLYPGLAIFLTVFAYNLLGESLRDALDPRIAKARH